MTTADEQPTGTTYGDVDAADGLAQHGEKPMDESAFDGDPAADEPGENDDIYKNPEVDPTEPVTDGEDG